MAHRVQQIIDAAATVMRANASLQATVEVNRVRSLGEDQGETPALTINYGGDSPDEAQNQSNFASAIELEFAAYVSGDTEPEVLESLVEMRRQVHRSIMADFTLGLPFVWDITYGGADKPATVQAERMLGAQTSRWTFRYLMDSDDPE
jgi:hypothetical protein